jgi:hypothetical protein
VGGLCSVYGRGDTLYILGDKAEGKRQVVDGIMNLYLKMNTPKFYCADWI